MSNSVVAGCRVLLISHQALDHSAGQRIWEICRMAGLRIRELDEASLDDLAASASALVVRVAPPCGWITPAEHGILSVRHREYYLNPIEGCQSLCSYCYLRSRSVGLRPLRLYIGVSLLTQAIDSILAETPEGAESLFCTGELADSLSESDLYPIGSYLTQWFGKKSHARLELRTKSDRVGSLLTLAHNERTIVAFSISPTAHIEVFERSTAPLEARLGAARACQKAGYPIALNMEPVVLTKHWQLEYRDLCERVVGSIDTSQLHHLSIGCLRFSGGLEKNQLFALRFGDLLANRTQLIEYRPGVFNGTFSFGERFNAYTWLLALLREYGINAPVYWSLEEAQMVSALKEMHGG